jgi:hypothetical protein
MKNIYEMGLHEFIQIKGVDNMFVLRVPGGWIYYKASSIGYATTFVPFDNEFQKCK